jgi:hypothetical protein
MHRGSLASEDVKMMKMDSGVVQWGMFQGMNFTLTIVRGQHVI